MRRFLLSKLTLLACVIVLGGSAHAQNAASAKTFLQSVYALYYKNGPGVEIAGTHARRYLHSSLIALLREDTRIAGPDEVGVLDDDPFCSCQDWDGIYNLKIDVHDPKAGKIEASVSFALFKDTKPQDVRSLVITLAQEKGAWRVYNVVDRSDPKVTFDLRKALEDEIRQFRRSVTPVSRVPR